MFPVFVSVTMSQKDLPQSPAFSASFDGKRSGDNMKSRGFKDALRLNLLLPILLALHAFNLTLLLVCIVQPIDDTSHSYLEYEHQAIVTTGR
jgi:hypothetical protein